MSGSNDCVALITHTAAFLSVNTPKCSAFKKAIKSMKRGEKSRFTVQPDFLTENEDEGMEEFLAGTDWDRTKPWVMDISLTKLVKVEDWYNDQSTMMRTLRKGKGRSPYTDSKIYFRILVEVNGNKVYSNYD